MAEESDILIEVEAAEAVYGDDCVVVTKNPPHLNLFIKPRTAEVSSQQFVEAIIGIRATSKYPDEPPEITIIDSKGLDGKRQKDLITSIRDKGCELSSNSMLVALCEFVEAIIGIRATSKYPDEPPEITIIDSKGLDGKRQKDLITSMRDKGCELSSNSMLVALCEEAVEKLTSMNHPDGDCPMCLHPLVEEGASNDSLPFMKLMSCFHCFHCECIIRWWNWLKTHKDVDHASSSGSTAHRQKTKTQPDMQNMEDGKGLCPVCRKVFHAKDLEHVLDLVGAHSQLEAVEKLTSMNHPDGDCPMCLHPLVEEGASNDSLPFMKLMSCFHCFHCECIIRWWNWLKTHKDVDHASSSGSTAHRQKTKTQPDMQNMEDGKGLCPVCRKVFHAKDLEHVLDLVGAHSQLNSEDAKDTENDSLLHLDSENARRQKFEAILKLQQENNGLIEPKKTENSEDAKDTENDSLLHLDSENARRQKFEAILKLQQENNGLIEPKKTEVLMPGMFLPRPAPTPTATNKEAANVVQATETKTNAGVSSNNHRRSSAPRSRYRGRNSKAQPNRQWIVKENGNAQ
ncbi:zinc finger, RING/FYVE/PHD-type, Ubiquitin-conjugating enzyme/RWD-like protein [Artemisia annua]|uniref:Zinc finger, RING/FYVE/PHD-type, Ubiquitin-conjugating enzyme/RWD-like protein n=1 Tax=Artemisia annua TaxID=35608 RepID=A0A2U1NU84_ARTAN|nr:zinc finger, RING/FYVE/PHD-type, Ubiquitin-conjugating enzyme/RWD-like protein [Artemisia annua]